MRRAMTTLLAALGAGLLAAAPCAASLDGTVTLGGTILNATGDRSTVQEMGDVYSGFCVSELGLHGGLGGGALLLDLRDLNLDSRQGRLVWRVPGVLRLDGTLDQHRRIFSPNADVLSLRRDWHTGLEVTPTRWLTLGGGFGYQERAGERLPWPADEAPGALATRTDDVLRTGEVTAQVHGGRRGLALGFQGSRYTDAVAPATARTGTVFSARAWSPCGFSDRLTHFVRAAYGVRRLSEHDLDWRLYDFGYTGVLEPATFLRLRYQFQADRVDDPSRDLRTERFVNEADATWFHRHGQVEGGYSYETNDDDRSLTSYHGWHAGALLRAGRVATARVEYAGRNKTDLEHLTLLQDIESSRLRARLELRPVPALALGSTFARRQRTFPGIGVDLDGDVVTAFGRWEAGAWGAVSGDYTHSLDDLQDRVGGWHLRGDVVSGRVETGLVPRLRLAAGATWLRFERDLDIEKSLVTAEGRWQVTREIHLAATYNAFNYDDYVLLDRYFTANVLRLGIGYDLHANEETR